MVNVCRAFHQNCERGWKTNLFSFLLSQFEEGFLTGNTVDTLLFTQLLHDLQNVF